MSAKGVEDAGTASSLGSEAVPAERPQARERPILFKAPMVRALLAGTKTQTRRIMDPHPPAIEAIRAKSGSDFSVFTDRHSPGRFRVAGPVWAVREMMGVEPDWSCPYGVPGDRLWVKETWAPSILRGHGQDACDCDTVRVDYRANGGWKEFVTDEIPDDWTMPKAARGGQSVTPLFMPRWASRITLEVTGVRVERLQDVSEEDAEAEGVASLDGEIDEVALCAKAKAMGLATDDARAWFATLWGSINGDSAWDANPWVWVISFRRLP